MKLSIITVTHNSESCILDTVKSLREQTFPRGNIEWILVDGGSTDKTLELIQQQDLHPDEWVSEPNAGLYDALNKGVEMATGDFVGFLHAGDVFAAPGVLYHVSCALQNSGADAVYGDMQYVRLLKNGDFNLVRRWKSGIYFQRKLQWGWVPPHPTLYIKREIYEQTKLESGAYFDTSYRHAGDYDFMMRAFGTHNLEPAYLMMDLVNMRLWGKSNRKQNSAKLKEEWRVIRQNHIGHLHTLLWKKMRKGLRFFRR